MKGRHCIHPGPVAPFAPIREGAEPRRIAKRRTARRRGEDGAAMFIVSMTIAVLASVGMYALAAAQNEVRTSGNERQNTQTHYLSEYGVIGVTHEMQSSKAAFYMGLMLNPTTIDTPCVSLPTVPNTASILTRACRRLGSAELGQAWGHGRHHKLRRRRALHRWGCPREPRAHAADG